MIIFLSKMCVLTPRLKKYLEVFHHQAVWQMTGMGPKCQHDGTWVYKPIGEALATFGLEEIGVYIS